MHSLAKTPRARGDRVRKARAKTAAAKPAPVRTPDAERTKANIIDIATKEFSEKGLDGARIDEIAEKTRTSKRMIYYYFESKDGLYLAVLENAYRRIRGVEHALDLDAKPPLEALADLVRFDFDYHLQNVDFIRLVMVENIQKGRHIAKLPSLRAVNQPTILMLRHILDRGVREGVMRADLDPVDLHMTYTAMCFYFVSNRYTFSHIFKADMVSPKATAARREIVADVVMRYVTK